jgi:hypothetical protein
MITLNKIAEEVAYELGEQFNMVLRELIKSKVIDYRALFIRQDLVKNGNNVLDYYQTYCLKLIEQEGIKCGFNIDRIVLVTETTIPKSLRIKGNGRVPFRYIGATSKTKPFIYTTVEEFEYLQFLPYQDKLIYYTYVNSKIAVLNTLKPCDILIEDIVADPRDIKDCNKDLIAPDDVEFPIPQDMLVSIKKSIKQDIMPQLAKDGETVNIDTDVRD